MRFIFIEKYKEIIKTWLAKYERYLSPVALFGGFIFDNLTLRRVDLWAENLVIIIYLSVALTCIIFINTHEAGWFRHRFFVKGPNWAAYLLQFVFGGLFSAFLIFYLRSASFVASWLFLLFLIAVLVVNEFLRERYQRLIMQLSIFFIALFSYSVFALPLLLRQIGAEIFILSGFLSLGLMVLIIFSLHRIMPERIRRSKDFLVVSIGGIYIAFHFLYLANIIPPIPLALKDSGIYHSVARLGSDYTVSLEPSAWYNFFKDYDTVFHWQPGQPVYCFSAIFAPAEIGTDIYHRWSFYDNGVGKWTEKDRLGFSIVGGRDNGYRGYSLKYGIQPGKWRVDVITERGQILGRLNFKIIETNKPVELKAEKR